MMNPPFKKSQNYMTQIASGLLNTSMSWEGGASQFHGDPIHLSTRSVRSEVFHVRGKGETHRVFRLYTDQVFCSSILPFLTASVVSFDLRHVLNVVILSLLQHVIV